MGGSAIVDLWEGLRHAFWLVVTFDAELAEIALRSLRVTLTALVIACLIALPLAALLAVRRFRWRRRPSPCSMPSWGCHRSSLG